MCSAPSEHYDTVIDRAALSSVSPNDLKKALFQVRRILKPGGVFLFNPYRVGHTKPFPSRCPRRPCGNGKGEDAVEHTLRILGRKLG